MLVLVSVGEKDCRPHLLQTMPSHRYIHTCTNIKSSNISVYSPVYTDGL